MFDGIDGIAAIVGKSEQNCRQLAARARSQIDERRPRFETSREQRERLVHSFVEAFDEGNVAGLEGLLAADGATRVIVTHDRERAAQADQLLELGGG